MSVCLTALIARCRVGTPMPLEIRTRAAVASAPADEKNLLGELVLNKDFIRHCFDETELGLCLRISRPYPFIVIDNPNINAR